MTVSPRPIPLRPDYSAVRSDPLGPFVRAATVLVRQQVKAAAPEISPRLSTRDDVTPLLIRAATNPASLGDSAYAGVLAGTTVSEFISNLGPASAASALFRSGLQLRFEGGVAVVPSVLPSAAGAGFVVEREPIPVVSLTVGTATLTPKKLGVISTLTGQAARHSDIERIVRETLTLNIGHALDSVVLGTAGGTTSAPAGLRSGVAAIAATAGGGFDAMREDLGNLVAAVAPVSGTNIVLIAAPDTAAKLMLSTEPGPPFPILSSAALTSGVLMAVAANAIAVAVDPVPVIDVSTESVLHSDTDPDPISTSGTPNVVAAPTLSLYTQDLIGVRVILGVSWGLRAAGAVAWVNATW